MEYRLETIYVKPYVKSYYEKKGLPDNERKFLHGLLMHPVEVNREIKACPKGCVAWRPIIPKKWHSRKLYRLTLVQAREFANLLESSIQHEFEIAFVNEVRSCRRHEVKFEIQELILHVREAMGLDEDSLPLETIRKYLQRYSKRENIFYDDVKKHKKTSSKVSRKKAINAAKAAKLPKGFIYLEQWLELVGISARTFRRCYRDEYPTKRIGRSLAIATVDAPI